MMRYLFFQLPHSGYCHVNRTWLVWSVRWDCKMQEHPDKNSCNMYDSKTDQESGNICKNIEALSEDQTKVQDHLIGLPDPDTKEACLPISRSTSGTVSSTGSTLSFHNVSFSVRISPGPCRCHSKQEKLILHNVRYVYITTWDVIYSILVWVLKYLPMQLLFFSAQFH